MKYITNLEIKDFDNHVVISCDSEDGFPCILIKNLDPKIITSSPYETDNLQIKPNVTLHVEHDDVYCHIIKSKKNDYISRQQFNIISNYVFKKISKEITDIELFELIDSLQEYFRITADTNRYELQIGVFGELLSVKVLYENGYHQILDKYHNNFYSKHDIEISNDTRIEIKTTENKNRIHKFKHDQIYRHDIRVYIISSILEPTESGTSLFDLFSEIMELYKNDPDSLFALNKLMKRCGISELDKGLKFALNKAIEDLRFYNSESIPRIEIDQPNGVTNIIYDSNCSFADSISIDELISELRK